MSTSVANTSSAGRSTATTVAIIDIGSNTTKMCVYAVEPGRWWRQLDELRAVVRLSAGLGTTGSIAPDAFERGLETLERFAAYVRAVGIDEVCATATSAVRSASNGDEFLAAARRRTGLEVVTLTGEEEATLGALAVANSFAARDMVVLDVGGGSAQLSLLKDRIVVNERSWPLGAVTTTERFISNDPPSDKEVAELRKHVRRSVKAWFAADPSLRGLPLVGMGGTIRNLGNLAGQLAGGRDDFLHGAAVQRRRLGKVVTTILRATAAERAQIAALSSDRADIIAAGAVVVHEIVKTAGVDELLISGHGLREGLLYRYLLPDSDPPLVADVRAFSVGNLRDRLGFTWPAAKDPEHVANLALSLYDALPPRSDAGVERELLAAAARLHDIGRAIDYRDHHKHAFGIIMSEPLPGFSHREQALVALMVRYQRSGKPSIDATADLLEEGDTACLERLAGVLRLAVAFDRTGTGGVSALRCALEKRTLTVTAVVAPDTDLGEAGGSGALVDLFTARSAAGLLENAYDVEVRVVRSD